MMKDQSEASVEHQGIIKEVQGHTAKVNLINVASCSSCHAKAACSVSEVDNKLIEIIDVKDDFKPGDKVKVVFQQNLGVKALILGYVLPFIVLLATLIISWEVTGDEVVSGLIAIFSIVPYYLGLTFFRKQMKETFTFSIKRY
jgi:sigma-E factor negative regulatory protein RseC